MATINCLFTNILQNGFCVQPKKESQTGFHFWVSYTFKKHSPVIFENH